MSQDRFDQWLRSQVDEEIHPGELNAEWMKYELRMDDHGRRRRGAIWWWITGWAILMVVLSLIFFYTSDKEIPHDDSDIDKTYIQSEDQKPIAQLEVQSERSTELTQVENQDEDRGAKLAKSNDQQKTYSKKNSLGIKQETRQSSSNQESIFLSQFTSSGTPISEGEPEDVFGSKQINKDNAYSEIKEIEISEFLPVLKSKIVHVAQSDPEIEFPSSMDQLPVNDQSIWSITSVLGAGKSFGRYSGDLDIDGLKYERSFQEVLSLEVLVWRQLNRNFKLGTGLALEYQHHQISQGNQISERGLQNGHVTDIIQMQDGSIQRQSGTANGVQTTTFDRTFHHEYISTSLPIGLAYESHVNSSWIFGARIMLQPTYYHHRLGMDVQPSDLEPYWVMDDLSESFDSRFTVGTGGSIYLGYCLTERLRVTAGVGGRTEIIGSSLSADRNQYLSTLQGQIGLQINM